MGSKVRDVIRWRDGRGQGDRRLPLPLLASPLPPGSSAAAPPPTGTTRPRSSGFASLLDDFLLPTAIRIRMDYRIYDVLTPFHEMCLFFSF